MLCPRPSAPGERDIIARTTLEALGTHTALSVSIDSGNHQAVGAGPTCGVSLEAWLIFTVPADSMISLSNHKPTYRAVCRNERSHWADISAKGAKFPHQGH